jgi:hypothetical protein
MCDPGSASWLAKGGDIDHVMAYGNEFHAHAFFLRFFILPSQSHRTRHTSLDGSKLQRRTSCAS